MKLRLKLSPVSIALWLAVALAAILILIFALFSKSEPDIIEDVIESDLVRVMTIKPRDLVQTIRLPGQVIPNRSVMLAAEIGGVITEMKVSKGDNVEKGQIVARIDHRHWEAQHRQAKVEARDATRDLERWKNMAAEGAVSQSEFDAVQRRQELAEIALELAQIQLDKSYLRAPANGIVDDRLLEAGAYANEGQNIFRFIEPTPMKVTLHIPERDVAMIRPEQKLNLHAQAFDHENPIQARVIFVGQEAMPPTFSYPAEVLIEDAPPLLRPGMIVDVEIERAILEDVLAVPLAAVVPRRGEHVVFLYRDGIAERTVVWIETMLNDKVVIKSGLTAGDKVIIAGHRALQDGVPVEIESDEE